MGYQESVSHSTILFKLKKKKDSLSSKLPQEFWAVFINDWLQGLPKLVINNKGLKMNVFGVVETEEAWRQVAGRVTDMLVEVI